MLLGSETAAMAPATTSATATSDRGASVPDGQGGDVHGFAALDGDGGAIGKARLSARDHRARRP